MLSKTVYTEGDFLFEDVFFNSVSSALLCVLIVFFWLVLIISLMNLVNILGKSLDKDVEIDLEMLVINESVSNNVSGAFFVTGAGFSWGVTGLSVLLCVVEW